MRNNFSQNAKQEIEERAKSKLQQMSTQEKAQCVQKEKKRTYWWLGISLFCCVSWVIGIISNINAPVDDNNPIGALALAIIVGITIAIFMIVKLLKNEEEIALIRIKRELKKELEENETDKKEEKDFSNFSISKEIAITVDGKSTVKLLIDDVRKQFIYQHNTSFSKTYDFCDLINYEVYENNKKTIQGRAGSALVGGVLFGVGGAIVGGSRQREINEACTQLQLIIRLNDLERPQIVIDYQIADKSVNLLVRYRMRENLQMVCSVLEYILNAKAISENDSVFQEDGSMNKSNKEQLQELKEMLDDGLITQEDFEQKKKQILGL
jgi:hypothetical protein